MCSPDNSPATLNITPIFGTVRQRLPWGVSLGCRYRSPHVTTALVSTWRSDGKCEIDPDTLQSLLFLGLKYKVNIATMYTRKRRLSIHQQSRLIEPFVAGTTARAAGELIGVQANTAIRYYMRLRHLIASKLPRYELSGEVEADESSFGGVRKGKRGRGWLSKWSCLAFQSAVARSIRRLLPTPKPRRCCPSFRKK